MKKRRKILREKSCLNGLHCHTRVRARSQDETCTLCSPPVCMRREAQSMRVMSVMQAYVRQACAQQAGAACAATGYACFRLTSCFANWAPCVNVVHAIGLCVGGLCVVGLRIVGLHSVGLRAWWASLKVCGKLGLCALPWVMRVSPLGTEHHRRLGGVPPLTWAMCCCCLGDVPLSFGWHAFSFCITVTSRHPSVNYIYQLYLSVVTSHIFHYLSLSSPDFATLRKPNGLLFL